MDELTLDPSPDGVAVTCVEPVLLSVPPVATMSRVARLAAGAMASLEGCSLEEIEDIKIAVSEVLIALVEHGGGQRIDLRFELAPDRFDVTGHTAVTTFDPNHSDLRLCRVVLGEVCSWHVIQATDGIASIGARVSRAAH